MLGLQHKRDRSRKDTTRNVAEAGSFVVNLVDEDLAKAMNVCAIDFPPASASWGWQGDRMHPRPAALDSYVSIGTRRVTRLGFGSAR